MKQILIEDTAILVTSEEAIEVGKCTVYTDDDTKIIYPKDVDYDKYHNLCQKTDLSCE